MGFKNGLVWGSKMGCWEIHALYISPLSPSMNKSGVRIVMGQVKRGERGVAYEQITSLIHQTPRKIKSGINDFESSISQISNHMIHTYRSTRYSKSASFVHEHSFF